MMNNPNHNHTLAKNEVPLQEQFMEVDMTNRSFNQSQKSQNQSHRSKSQDLLKQESDYDENLSNQPFQIEERKEL